MKAVIPDKTRCFFGEIDDLEKVRQFLAVQPYVDANRIYLVGHSTDGTRVLLASELLTGFRAIFSLGGVSDVKKWWGNADMSFLPFDRAFLLNQSKPPLFTLKVRNITT